MAGPRLFIATDIPAEARGILGDLAGELELAVPKRTVRWVPPENIHLTLRFLGNTDAQLLPELQEGLDAVAVRYQPVVLRLDRLGCFPKPSRPRVVWVGVRGAMESLYALQSDVEATVRQLGFAAERRRFHPHLTLGRVRDSRLVAQAKLPWGQSVEAVIIEIDRLLLVQSDLRPSGAVYNTLHESPFNAGRAAELR